jgi:hypothetical protein
MLAFDQDTAQLLAFGCSYRQERKSAVQITCCCLWVNTPDRGTMLLKGYSGWWSTVRHAPWDMGQSDRMQERSAVGNCGSQNADSTDSQALFFWLFLSKVLTSIIELLKSAVTSRLFEAAAEQLFSETQHTHGGPHSAPRQQCRSSRRSVDTTRS